MNDVRCSGSFLPVPSSKRIELEVGEFVIARERRRGLGRALELDDFLQRLHVEPALRVFARERLAVGIRGLEHQPVADVAVVWDRDHVAPRGARTFDIDPQVFGPRRLHRIERQLRHDRAAEDHVAMQVAVVGRRAPLECDEGGELARCVVLLGELLDALPDWCDDHRVGQVRVWLALTRDRPCQLEVRFLAIRRVLAAELGSHRLLIQRMLRVNEQLRHAHVLGVVGHGGEVERGIAPDRFAVHVTDGLALGEAIRNIRIDNGVLKGKRVEGPARMQVQLAEVRVAIRVDRGPGPLRDRCRISRRDLLGLRALLLTGSKCCEQCDGKNGTNDVVHVPLPL